MRTGKKRYYLTIKLDEKSTEQTDRAMGLIEGTVKTIGASYEIDEVFVCDQGHESVNKKCPVCQHEDWPFRGAR